jgi:hypothetical protein
MLVRALLERREGKKVLVVASNVRDVDYMRNLLSSLAPELTDQEIRAFPIVTLDQGERHVRGRKYDKALFDHHVFEHEDFRRSPWDAVMAIRARCRESYP